MDTIGVGLVGAGFVADVHARVYAKMAGQGVQLVAVTSRTRARAEELAKRYHIEKVAADLGELLQLPDVHVIDLCVPNQLHKEFSVQAMQAGKHVICEKPLTAYCGEGEVAVGATPKAKMLTAAMRSADEMVAALESQQDQTDVCRELAFFSGAAKGQTPDQGQRWRHLRTAGRREPSRFPFGGGQAVADERRGFPYSVGQPPDWGDSSSQTL